MRRMWRVAWFALVAVGCGSQTATTPVTTGSAPAPADAAVIADAAPLDRDLPRLAARSVKLYQAILEAFRAAGEDCAAATARLRSLQAEYAEVVAANAKVLYEGRTRDLEAALAPHDAVFDAAARQIMSAPTLAACVRDEPFARAFDELVGAPP
jgi:hypothetical protein